MYIELDISSGVPNPVWALDEADWISLHRLQGTLLPCREVPPTLPGLGYRGFCYGVAGNRFRAYAGYVHSAEVVLADPTLSIERFLGDRLPIQFAHFRAKLDLQ